MKRDGMDNRWWVEKEDGDWEPNEILQTTYEAMIADYVEAEELLNIIAPAIIGEFLRQKETPVKPSERKG